MAEKNKKCYKSANELNRKVLKNITEHSNRLLW